MLKNYHKIESYKALFDFFGVHIKLNIKFALHKNDNS